METKISNVTTLISVKSVHKGYEFSGTVSIYNNQKIIKDIKCKVVKLDNNSIPIENYPTVYYVVFRGLNNEYSYPQAYSSLEVMPDEILFAGIEFEAMINSKINSENIIENIL